MEQHQTKPACRGVIVPLVTPLDARGRLDAGGATRLVERVVAAGCAPFVGGTTGEAASLAEDTRTGLVEIAVAAAAGAELVYAGIAGNCLENCLERARRYARLGADVAVCHLPAYYPLDEEQMRAWYLRLADACPLPLMLYNIPATTSLSIPLPLVEELSRHENVVGMKDSERDEERMRECAARWRAREDFTLHVGWAARSAWGVENGFDAIVPSSANLVPGLYRRLYDAAARGDAAEAARLQALTDEIGAVYQQGRSLGRSLPVLKAMLAALGVCQPFVAPPLLALPAAELEAVARVVRERWPRYGEAERR